MSKETITKVKRKASGAWVKLADDGGEAPLPAGKTDWARVQAISDDEALAAAKADLDAQPLTSEDIASGKAKRVPQVKVIRRALRLSQEEFAARYHIPIGTLRDWEQGRSEPDAPGRALLKLIAREPEFVRETLMQA
jgi:putative transcriptional regulator